LNLALYLFHITNYKNENTQLGDGTAQ